MPRFRKATDKDYVIIPEIGRVVTGQVLEGGQWRRYVDAGLLEEIPGPDPQISVSESSEEEEETFAPSFLADPLAATPTEFEAKMDRRGAARRKGLATT